MSIGKPILSVLALVGVALAGTPAGEGGATPAVSPWYTITDLGTLGGWRSSAWGVNDLGQVVGGADTIQGLRHAFLWENGQMQDLGTLSPLRPQSVAYDVNNVGQVVGYSFASPNVPSAFIWDAGQMTDLGHLSGASSGDTIARAINDAGQVVGRSRISITETHAFRWEDGVMTDLGTLGGDYSLAWDVNAAGHVVGVSSTGGVPGGAFLWRNGMMENLPTLGGAAGEAFGINDSSQVVGWALREDNSLFHAFLWDDGEMIDIDAIAGLESNRGRAINNTGQILLGAGLFDIAAVELFDPHDLLPCDSGWSSLNPRDMNDAGQVVGAGWVNGSRHAFVMTPLTEPPPQAPDCQPNGVPDNCEIFEGTSEDCNDNEVPDECDLRDGTSRDCNENDIPDACDIAEGTTPDCNDNDIPDQCDLDMGTSGDCNSNGIPDECDPDCDGNEVPDDCDLAEGTSPDCNGNRVPDQCDVLDGTSGDCNENGVPDECEADCNTNAIADECELDSDGDEVIDDCDGCPLDADKTTPGVCGCGSPEADDDDDGVLNCDDQCNGIDDAMFAPHCVDEIPTVSQWGLIVMTLLLLAAGKIYGAPAAPGKRTRQ